MCSINAQLIYFINWQDIVEWSPDDNVTIQAMVNGDILLSEPQLDNLLQSVKGAQHHKKRRRKRKINVFDPWNQMWKLPILYLFDDAFSEYMYFLT